MKNTTRGFSLIELLVALSILAVVAAIIVPRFLNVRTSAAQATAQAQQQALQNALEQCISLGVITPATLYPADFLQFVSTQPAAGATRSVCGWKDSTGTISSSSIVIPLPNGNSLNYSQTTAPTVGSTAGFYVGNASGTAAASASTGAAYYVDGAGTVWTITITSQTAGTISFTGSPNGTQTTIQ